MAITINGSGTITGYTPTAISGQLTRSNMPSGSIIQYKYAVLTGGEHTADSTSDEDVPGMSVSIAKTNASNLIVCEISFTPYFGGTSTMRMNLKIKRDNTEIYSKPYGVFRSGGTWKSSESIMRKVDTGANDTNSHTYKFVTKREDGSDNMWFDDDGVHTITVMEVVA